MVNPMFHSVRTFLLVSMVALSAGLARAAQATGAGSDVAAEPVAGDGPPVEGMLIAAGIVAVLVFIAWLAARIGDSRSHDIA